jgi:single-strand DNA-binding protein
MDLMFVQIAGNMGSDPETRHTPSGQKITTFRLAVNTKRQGKEKTVWWRVTIFGDRFDKLLPYLKKGTALMVMGTMNPPELWQDRDGNTQISVEMIAEFITFAGGASREKSETSPQGYAQPQSDYEVVTSLPQTQFSRATPAAVGMGVPGLGAQPEMNEDIPF